MNFYLFLQEQVESQGEITTLANEIEQAKATEYEQVTNVEDKREHKLWVDIVINRATNMSLIDSFNDAWRGYQAYQDEQLIIEKIALENAKANAKANANDDNAEDEDGVNEGEDLDT